MRAFAPLSLLLLVPSIVIANPAPKGPHTVTESHSHVAHPTGTGTPDRPGLNKKEKAAIKVLLEEEHKAKSADLPLVMEIFIEKGDRESIHFKHPGRARPSEAAGPGSGPLAIKTKTKSAVSPDPTMYQVE